MNALLIAAALFQAVPSAPHSRLAVVVGANGAPPGLTPLKYAHQDAVNMAAALSDVGEFDRADVRVLLDPTPEAVLGTLDEVTRRLAGRSDETLLVFYYSGHADDGALFPSGQRLPLATLKERLDRTGATVRVGILDACRGGSWTQAKGLSRTAPFAVDVPLALVSEGSALLASSSGKEDAHEAESIEGSYFTHHLVAAMRGAGSRSGAGEVTLADAFAYADRMTIRDTAARAEEPQHPSFELKLRGRRDVVLSRVPTSPSLLVLAEQTGPIQLVQLSTGVVLLELPPGQETWRLAVPPGDYLVRRPAAGGNATRQVSVSTGEPVHLSEADLELVGAPGLSKGAPEVEAGAGRHELSVGGTVMPFDAFTKQLGPELSYTFHFSEHFAIRGRYAYQFGIDSGLKKTLLGDFGVLPTQFSWVQSDGALEVVASWLPFHLSANRNLPLWLDIAAGPGIQQLVDAAPAQAVQGTVCAEAGARLGIWQGLSARLGVRTEVVPGRAYEILLSTQLAASYSFGAGG